MASGVADANAFLTRLLRLDPAAPVRLVPAGGQTALWAPLPWDVLVTRGVEVDLPAGVLPAGQLLEALESGAAASPPAAPGARVEALLAGGAPAQWRWGVPPGPGELIELLPAADVRRLGAAAAQTLREVAETGIAGRPVGQRAVRDALLDHVPVAVEAGGRRVGVPQRLVQAILRMGFVDRSLAADATVAVSVLPGWVGLVAPFGSGWWRPASRLSLTPVRAVPKHTH